MMNLTVSPFVQLIFFLFIDVAYGRQFDSISLCKERVETLQQTSPNLGLTLLLRLGRLWST